MSAFDIIVAILAIVPISTIVTIILAIRTFAKGPHIVFHLFKDSKITLFNGKKEERISLITAPIENSKKRFSGETAKKLSVRVIYEASTQKGEIRAFSNDIPWLNTYPLRVEIEGSLKKEKDIQKALETYFFHREERDIPQGRGEHLLVAYGIEKFNKIFLATNPPIGILLPKKKSKKVRKKSTNLINLALEVAGENLPSTVSKQTLILVEKWNDFGWTTKIEKIYSPNKITNFLLGKIFGSEIKVIGSDKSKQ